MKLFALILVCSAVLAQNPPKEVKKAADPPPVAPVPVDPEKEKEQQELNKAIGEAGNSPIDFMRALENHLKKYPNSAQKANIEKAIAKAAVETKDDKRIIEYGQRALAVDGPGAEGDAGERRQGNGDPGDGLREPVSAGDRKVGPTAGAGQL
jgi:hypothetical protein